MALLDLDALYYVQPWFAMRTAKASSRMTDVTYFLGGLTGDQKYGQTGFRANTLEPGVVIRLTASGHAEYAFESIPDPLPRIAFGLCFPGRSPICSGFLEFGPRMPMQETLAGDIAFWAEFLLTIRKEGRGGVVASGMVTFGSGNQWNLAFGPGLEEFESGQATAIDLRAVLTHPGNILVTLEQCFVELTGGAVVEVPGLVAAQGVINGTGAGGALATAGSYSGTLSSSVSYAGSLFASAASQNLGSTSNAQSITFTYQGPEAGGGVAAGTRWSDLGQQGDLAFVNTSAMPPTITLIDMPGGWASGASNNSSGLTLTSGNSYALTIADDGVSITASLVDDAGLQTVFLTPAAPASNAGVMFGWVGTTAS